MNKSAPASFDLDLDKTLTAFQKLAAKRGPVFTWQMIGTCVKYKKQFPDWVINYLAQCAERMCDGRMQSERAKRADDVGKMFQWIFDFPKKKPGPGELLDAGGELLKETCKAAFAFHFALKLHQGEDPIQARRNAGDEWFGIIGDETVDDRTLQRYLREQFQLKKLPRTAEEWMPVIAWDRLLLIAKKLAHD